MPERTSVDFGKVHSLRLGIGDTATIKRLSLPRSPFRSTHNHYCCLSLRQPMRRRPIALSRAISTAMVDGFITCLTNDITQGSEWMLVVGGDGFARPKKLVAAGWRKSVGCWLWKSWGFYVNGKGISAKGYLAVFKVFRIEQPIGTCGYHSFCLEQIAVDCS